jgi:DNA replication protein DnaC
MVTTLLKRREERQLERLELIVLDELGYIPFSKPGADLLFEVISRAYEHTSLIVT